MNHKGISRYIDSEHYVVDKQLDKNKHIKDGFVLDILDKTLRSYRYLISKLDSKIDPMTADSIKEYLLEQNGEIDFIKFVREVIAQLKQEAEVTGEHGKRATAAMYQTAIYSQNQYEMDSAYLCLDCP
ncbi:Phage integrase SAM-like domain-containing protein [bacterium A37T11]|nr:Phage integrase SAM-like domain-containing protein [bacterium A37T11]